MFKVNIINSAVLRPENVKTDASEVYIISKLILLWNAVTV